ncbi:hypothetical protein OH799_27915 [Nocardia sp. NBC_00881]|nr:hypothetical protein OH799_27915 [Nocardia sp. NBC_00881]
MSSESSGRDVAFAWGRLGKLCAIAHDGRTAGVLAAASARWSRAEFAQE